MTQYLSVRFYLGLCIVAFGLYNERSYAAGFYRKRSALGIQLCVALGFYLTGTCYSNCDRYKFVAHGVGRAYACSETQVIILYTVESQAR